MNKNILVIDDKPEEARGQLLKIADSLLDVVHPEDLSLAHLASASLILVDHHLEDSNWSERSQLPVACQPLNGVALAAVVQAHLKSERLRDKCPAAVALFSARLQEVTIGLENPPEHLAAQACGLDWAFSKRTASGEVEPASRVLDFATAIEQLPGIWPSTDPMAIRAKVASLLGLGEQEWSGTASAHVERCHPPIHEIARWTDGVAFVRWFAQRILPYPSFLVDDQQLAVRLGVKPKWLKSEFRESKKILREFKSALYEGILSKFLGRRWWIAGIDSILWNKKLATDSRLLLSWLGEIGKKAPTAVSMEETLVLDKNFSFDGVLASYADCVRVWPDGWPSYADAPWTTVARARENDRLRAVVLGSEIERVV